MKRLTCGFVAIACLGLVAAGTGASQFSLVTAALADKGGNGHGGGGNGGGNGSGGGAGKGNSGNHGKSSANGKSSAHGKSASAHAKEKASHDNKTKVQKASIDKSKQQKVQPVVEDDIVVDDMDDNTLGPLNAAHASARARERAAPNSSVGKIATYERSREAALALADPVEREQALDDAVAQLESDFGRTLTDAQVDEVNDLLDARR